MDEPIADVLPYVRDALHWTHVANPNARLMINEYRIIPANKYRHRYRDLVTALKKESAPLHAIGIQAHSPGNGAHWFSPEEIWQTCELFGAELGFPIYFTEFRQVSDPQRTISGAHAPLIQIWRRNSHQYRLSLQTIRRSKPVNAIGTRSEARLHSETERRAR